MHQFLPEWLDRYARRHPRLMTAAVIAMAVAVTPVLLFLSQAPTVLYQTF